MPTITDLRTHLFDTLTTLKDKEKPMDRARQGGRRRRTSDCQYGQGGS